MSRAGLCFASGRAFLPFFLPPSVFQQHGASHRITSHCIRSHRIVAWIPCLSRNPCRISSSSVETTFVTKAIVETPSLPAFGHSCTEPDSPKIPLSLFFSLYRKQASKTGKDSSRTDHTRYRDCNTRKYTIAKATSRERTTPRKQKSVCSRLRGKKHDATGREMGGHAFDQGTQ